MKGLLHSGQRGSQFKLIEERGYSNSLTTLEGKWARKGEEFSCSAAGASVDRGVT